MNTTIVFIVVLAGLAAWLLSIFVREKKRHQITKFKVAVNAWLKYLQSDAIKQGDFSMFEEVSIEFIKNQRDLIATNFGYLMQENPEKIINLINLNLDQDKKEYLDELLAKELAISVKNTIDIAFNVWERSDDTEADITIISYIAGILKKDNRTTFARELKSKIRATGGYLHISLTNDLEEIVGVRV